MDLGERSLTFGEIDRAANRIGRTMRDLGAARGERVAVVGAMNLSLVPVFAAAAKLGAVYAAVDPELDPDTLLDVLQLARSVARRDRRRAGEFIERAGNRARRARNRPRPARPEQRRRRRPGTAGGRSERARSPGLVLPRDAAPGGRREWSSRTGCSTCGPSSERSRGGEEPASVRTRSRTSPPWELALRQWQARSRLALVEAGNPAALCEAVSTHRASYLTAPPSLFRGCSLPWPSTRTGGAS